MRREGAPTPPDPYATTLRRGTGKFGEDVISNLAGQSGLGGFGMKEENRLAEVARQDQDTRNFWDQVGQQRALETTSNQNALMTGVQSAIASGDFRRAAALSQALQASGSVRPFDYGTQQANQATAQSTRAGIPFLGPKAQQEIAESKSKQQYYEDTGLGSLAKGKAALTPKGQRANQAHVEEVKQAYTILSNPDAPPELKASVARRLQQLQAMIDVGYDGPALPPQ
jgi:hypothetical protein